MDKLKEGDKVKAWRRDGKNGMPYETTGEFIRYMNIVLINGERTGLIKYDADGVEYPCQLSKITKI